MTTETATLSALIAIMIAGIAVAFRRNRKIKELRDLLEFTQIQVVELQDAVTRGNESQESTIRRAADQSRRLAWLESKIRKPRLSPDQVLDDSVLTEQPKLSMTERRHRVINLASRGKSVETIAASLGLFKGEVELILNLNRAAAAGGR